MSPLRSFLLGFRAPFSAILFVFRAPSLLALMSMPLLISLALSAFFFIYVNGIAALYVGQTTHWMALHAPLWLASAGAGVLRITVWVSLFVISTLGFTVVGGVLASPFNDWLSKRVSLVRMKKGQSAPPPRLRAGAEVNLAISEVISLELKRTAILLVLGGIAVVLGMIPFFQIPALVLGALAVAFEYLGFPVSRRDPRIVAVVKFMAVNPFRSLGLGAGILTLMAIPLAGVVTIPLAVVGATLVHDELLSPSRAPR